MIVFQVPTTSRQLYGSWTSEQGCEEEEEGNSTTGTGCIPDVFPVTCLPGQGCQVFPYLHPVDLGSKKKGLIVTPHWDGDSATVAATGERHLELELCGRALASNRQEKDKWDTLVYVYTVTGGGRGQLCSHQFHAPRRPPGRHDLQGSSFSGSLSSVKAITRSRCS